MCVLDRLYIKPKLFQKSLVGFSGVASQIDLNVRIPVSTFLPWQIKILRVPQKMAKTGQKSEPSQKF